MALLFKITGVSLVITTCTLIGFSKAHRLKIRVDKLRHLQNGIARLKELIRHRGGEIDKLILQCFNSYPVDLSGLEPQERGIAQALFNEIGLQGTQNAYNQCEICLSLLKSVQADAEQKYRENAKLYRSVGFLFGAFICIFFI